ncbi:hypothetical protein RhiirA4_451830 [Rhizophagus irregularis]|uniref:Uncharacterized protein n=1 Tax=Rhizophagus irregularis TaxID=588596 RepID=A0A2I1FWR5_9GLOM|nr:hypothetical protein RhiirA4_451830 [Rhizophagus irregularis]
MAFLRKFIQTNSLNTSLFQFFPQFFLSNVSSLKPLKIFPIGSFDDLRQEGYYYLDKTHFISKIEAECAPDKVACLNLSKILRLVSPRFYYSFIIVLASGLKTACNEGVACIFLTGMTPISMDDFISGFNISVDLTLKEEFWDLYGFKRCDIKILLDKAFGNDVSNDIKQKKYLNNKYIKCDKYATVNFDTLFDFPSNPHILSIQTILNLIVNNPLGKSILIKALNQHLNLCNSVQSFIFSQGIKQRFQLSNIHELATDHTSLLSFMFYSGVITYQLNSSYSSLQHNFQIPNRITERKFIIEMLKIYNWKKEDLIPVQNCLQILEAEYNIEPLCRFIENNLLKLLKYNNVKHLNEEVLKQIFMDTLTLTLHTDIKPKFQMFSQSSNFEKIINLVKINTEKVIAIEFDNIKIESIKLDGIQSSWQKATDISQLLLEKSDDEILIVNI